MTLTGSWVGLEVDSKTNLMYVKQRYAPILNPSPIPIILYTLGAPTQT